MLGTARGVARRAGAFARNPVRYTKSNPVPGAVFLALALIAIAVLRRGALPDERGMIAIAFAVGAVVAAAALLPDFVTWLLLVALVVSLLQNSDLIVSLVDAGTRRFNAALSEVA